MSSEKEASFLMRLVDMVSGPLKSITGAASATTKHIEGVTGAVDKLKGKGSVLGDLQKHFQKLKGGVSDAADEIPGLNRMIALVKNPYVAVAAGIVAVGLAAVDATGRAMSFEKGMSQVNTTARLNVRELGLLRGELLEMGGKSTVNLAEIPGAFNSVISAVGETGKALDIFRPSLKAAQAGFTDIKTVTEAATNVLGSVKNATPTEAFDVMFATMRLGKAEFKDIAAYLPRIIPLANNVGVSFQEISAAFALMTTKGQSAEQTTMLLQNAMTSLSKSEVIYGTKSQAGFIRSGVAIFDHAGKMRKLVDIVGDLSARTQGMTDKQKQAFLNGLGLDAQASASFSVLAQNASKLREFVQGTTDSAGEMNKAYELSLSPVDKLKILQNQWSEMLTRVGYKILPYVNTALETGLRWVEKIKANSEPISHYFAAVAAPVRVIWSTLKGVYNVLDLISEKTGGGGSMGNLLQHLFGGSSELWPQIQSFFDKFFQLLDVTASAIDDASAGHFKQALTRLNEFQAKMDGKRAGQNVLAGALPGSTWLDNFSLRLPVADNKADSGGGKTKSAAAALAKQNKGTDIEGDKSKARIINVRIDKIEVIAKVANAAGQGLQEIGNQVASIIVGAVRDSEIILSNG